MTPKTETPTENATLAARRPRLALALAALLALPLAGCDSDTGTATPRSGGEAAAAAAPAPGPTFVAEESPPAPAEAAAASAEVAPADSAEVTAHLEALAPVRTRAGHLRFADPLLGRPEASEVLARRLADKGAPAEERLALAEALHRSGGAWSTAILAQLPNEADPEVRSILIGTLGKAPKADALAGLDRGLADPEAGVRRAACELAGWAREAGAEVQPRLVAALGDGDPRVRAAAARSLGLVGDAAASFDALVPRLGDGDPDVRLQALRALGRLDRARTSALGALGDLAGDDDPRIQRAVAELAR